jgi:hypothetical protein
LVPPSAAFQIDAIKFEKSGREKHERRMFVFALDGPDDSADGPAGHGSVKKGEHVTGGGITKQAPAAGLTKQCGEKLTEWVNAVQFAIESAKQASDVTRARARARCVGVCLF